MPAEEKALPLCRLRFTGVLHTWDFAFYLASREKPEDNFLPTGLPFGSLEEALDCACLYLGDPTPWHPSTNFRGAALVRGRPRTLGLSAPALEPGGHRQQWPASRPLRVRHVRRIPPHPMGTVCRRAGSASGCV